jgi:hypothetical protein
MQAQGRRCTNLPIGAWRMQIVLRLGSIEPHVLRRRLAMALPLILQVLLRQVDRFLRIDRICYWCHVPRFQGDRESRVNGSTGQTARRLSGGRRRGGGSTRDCHSTPSWRRGRRVPDSEILYCSAVRPLHNGAPRGRRRCALPAGQAVTISFAAIGAGLKNEPSVNP